MTDEGVTSGSWRDDDADVASRLGREPGGAYAVVLRNGDGAPVVIANEPFLRDGTPMPTRYWLVDPDLRSRVGRLEAEGGVRRAEVEVDPEAVAASHLRYATERDALDSSGLDRPQAERGRRRYPTGREMPTRASGVVAGRR